ncbi:MAG: protein kinase, partial [Desulfobacterales bacterium]
MMKKGTVISLEKGKYEITGFIGEGAYGVVWEARRIPDGEIFALKTVQFRDERGIYSFQQKEAVIGKLEIEIAFLKKFSAEESLAHHIVPLVDSGIYEEKPVMVMMRCDHNLNTVYGKRVKNSQTFPFDAQTFLDWIAQTAKALLKIHSTQTEDKSEDRIYALRDLKFDNVLCKDSNLYLSDFGTVKPIRRKLNLTGSIGCTPEWAAPEMLIPAAYENHEVKYSFSPKVDIYALGLMMYALITGKPTAAQKLLGQYLLVKQIELKYGEVGGLTGEERQILRENLWRLFSAGGGTVGFGAEKICTL